MALCCAFNDYLEYRRKKRRQGSESISEEYPSDRTTEGSIVKSDLPPVEWEDITACYCAKQHREPRSVSCPSHLSSPRHPTNNLVRTRSLSHAHRRSRQCNDHNNLCPPNPPNSIEELDRCASRLSRTRQRRLQRTDTDQQQVPTNVCYFKTHRAPRPETEFSVNLDSSTSSDSDEVASLLKTVVEIHCLADNIETRSKKLQKKYRRPRFPVCLVKLLNRPTDSETTTAVTESPERINTTAVVQTEPLPIYVTSPTKPTTPISPPYARPSCSHWPDPPYDAEDFLPRPEVQYLTIPSQASFNSRQQRQRPTESPLSLVPPPIPPQPFITESITRVHNTTSIHSLPSTSRISRNRTSIPEVYPRSPDRDLIETEQDPRNWSLHSTGNRDKKTNKENNKSTVIMNEEYRDRKIVLEFTHLLEKSKQLFTGLRALPQHGHKHWQFYFSRTFDVYTKLWKYQQQHRGLLNEEYGLRRWQIGEIASKIGQLYYHFYLRTSEVTYLFDAFEFYAAIRGRGYYAKAANETNGDLMIKRLRYYTRFIVVSLLTRKLKFVEELISEFDEVIMEYGDSYDPEDQIQWTMVSSEVKAFLAVECAIIIEDPECKKSLRTKTRLTPVSIPCIDKTPQMNLRLQKAVIIGSGSYQSRVSELTIDMYRILQTLEREPVQSREVWQMPQNPFADGFDRAFNIEIATANAPEKNLLFKPSPTQALVFIASACEDLSPIGALLLYISADGVSPNTKGVEDCNGFETGGLITTSKRDIYGEIRASTPARYKEIQCLHPGDLQPFTRKPLFLIVDSDHSTIFLKMRRPFEMPMVILMSPTEFPPALKEYENMGGLLTLFLYCPLGAVCKICSVANVTADMWVEAQILINNFLQEAVVVSVRLPLDSSYICFLGDDFLRVQIARYIFCEVVLRMHRGFSSRNYLPRASPALPEQLFENIALTEMVLELASFLKIRGQFFNPLSGSGNNN